MRTKVCAATDCETTLKWRGPNYCSAKCRSVTYKGRGRKSFDTCKCGKEFYRYWNGNRRKYCSDECEKKFYTRPPTSEEQKAKLSAIKKGKPLLALRGHKQTEEHLIKRLGTTAIRASKEELALVEPLAKLGFRHTGEGTFWRRWPDGTLHNPDFVNEERREIIEYFGAYWHADDRGREDYIREQWAALGWDCRIIWSDDEAISWGATNHA
jgi:hypothetical protein